MAHHRPRPRDRDAGARRLFRWVICALLFLAATINYVDRQVIGILKPTLQHEFGWSRDRLRRHRLRVPARVRDRLRRRGPRDRSPRHARRIRRSRSCVWSLAAIGARRGAALRPGVPRSARRSSAWRTRRRSPASCVDARCCSASASRATFRRRSRPSPSGFRRRERALATGIFNSGTNVGALVTPLVVPWITLHVRLVLGVHRDRRARLPLAGRSGCSLYDRPRRTRGVARPSSRYIRSDPADPRRARAVASAAAAPPDLGVRDRQVPDRSGLVAVSVLDSGFPQPQLRPRPQARSGRRSSRFI